VHKNKTHEARRHKLAIQPPAAAHKEAMQNMSWMGGLWIAYLGGAAPAGFGNLSR
jgi:hypothetical protein